MAEKWALYYHDESNNNSQLYKCKLSKKYSFTSDGKLKTACEIYFRGLPDGNVNQIINGDMKPLNENGLIIQITQAGKFSGNRQFYAIDLNKFHDFKNAVTYKLKYDKVMYFLDEMIKNNNDVQKWYGNLWNIATYEKTATCSKNASYIIDQFAQLSQMAVEPKKFVKKAKTTRRILKLLIGSALCKEAVKALEPIEKNSNFVDQLTVHVNAITSAQL